VQVSLTTLLQGKAPSRRGRIRRTRKRSTRMMYDHFNMYVFGPVHMLVLGLILIIPFSQLFAKAGYSGWWSLLMLIPLVNLVALYILAFSDWPAMKK
jgi:hypothetical protein